MPSYDPGWLPTLSSFFRGSRVFQNILDQDSQQARSGFPITVKLSWHYILTKNYYLKPKTPH